MKKLLVIGAGIGQLSLVKKAKEMGCYVVVVTVPGEWITEKVADEVWYIDIYERDAIVEKAKEEHIDAVISDQNDLMMPTVAYVAEKLGLPGNTYEQVYSYCNKNIFRDNCDYLGIPVPKHIAVKDVDFDFENFDCPFPWIVKPADSQSSIGVKKVDNLDELKGALKEAIARSKTKEAIVEEFFVGKEMVCEGFVDNGRYYNLSFADRKYFDLNKLMIPSQTLFPSNTSETIRMKILECERKMTEYIKPAFGITHSEYLYNEETGEIRVVETALRGGGVFISSHLIPLATGIDINDILLFKALGMETNVEKIMQEKIDKASGYVCFYLKEGTITSVEGIEVIQSFPFVKMALLDGIEAGQKTEKMTYKGARKGPILVVGNSREELEQNVIKVQNTLHVLVEKDGIESDGIIWE